MSRRLVLLSVAIFTAAQGAWAQGTAPTAAPKDPVKRGSPVRLQMSNSGPAEIEVLGWSFGATNDQGSWTTSSLKIRDTGVTEMVGDVLFTAPGPRILRLRMRAANSSLGREGSIECVVDRSSTGNTVQVGDLSRFFTANGAANPTTCRTQ